MPILLGNGEPFAGPWRAVPIDALLDAITGSGPAPAGRPWIVAVDGRAGSGKSILANRLCEALRNTAVVHTDDLLGHSFFGWCDLLIDGVLRPLHDGSGVHYRPPHRDLYGRHRLIDLASGLDLVVIEGVGSSQRALGPWIDGSIWIQADVEVAEQRWIARDGGPEVVGSLGPEWMAGEVAFLEQDRPWERASVIVAGTPGEPYDRRNEVLIATALNMRPGTM